MPKQLVPARMLLLGVISAASQLPTVAEGLRRILIGLLNQGCGTSKPNRIQHTPKRRLCTLIGDAAMLLLSDASWKEERSLVRSGALAPAGAQGPPLGTTNRSRANVFWSALALGAVLASIFLLSWFQPWNSPGPTAVGPTDLDPQSESPISGKAPACFWSGSTSSLNSTALSGYSALGAPM